MISFSLNLLVAILWLLLSDDPHFGTFLVGFVVGFALIAVFRPLLKSDSYVHRAIAFLRFLLKFTREIILSTFTVARAVLFQPIDTIDPDFIDLDVSDLRRGEIFLLTHCITLTPGTTSIDISPDFKLLTVHAFDASDPDAVRASIRTGLLAPILAFTRPWTPS